MYIGTIVDKAKRFQYIVGEDRVKVLQQLNRLIEAKTSVAPENAEDAPTSFAHYQESLQDSGILLDLSFVRMRLQDLTHEPEDVADGSTAPDAATQGAPGTAETTAPVAPKTTASK